MLQVHQAQVGLDRYRRPPNRAGKTRNERLQESLIVEKLIHRRQLRRQRPHLCRHHRVEQLRLTVAQPEHQSLLRRELDREQRRTRSSIVPADASLRRIVFQGDVANQRKVRSTTPRRVSAAITTSLKRSIAASTCCKLVGIVNLPPAVTISSINCRSSSSRTRSLSC